MTSVMLCIHGWAYTKHYHHTIISGPALCNVTMERGGVEFSQ